MSIWKRDAQFRTQTDEETGMTILSVIPDSERPEVGMGLRPGIQLYRAAKRGKKIHADEEVLVNYTLPAGANVTS